MPYELHTTARLYNAFSDILSDAEVLTSVIEEAKNVSTNLHGESE
jgi:hypothetical protein